MEKKDEEGFRKRLLVTFKGEAEDHVRALSAGLIALEKAAEAEERQGIVETVFRETHSLKGAARAVGRSETEGLCQALENVFSLLKGGAMASSPTLMDLLFAAVELLRTLLADIEGTSAGIHDDAALELRQRLLAAAGGMEARRSEVAEEAALQPPPKRAAVEAADSMAPELPSFHIADTVRVAVPRLDAILFQSESMLGAKLTARQRAEDLRGTQAAFASAVRERARVAPEVRGLQRRLERGEHKADRRSDDPQLRRLLEYLVQQDEFLKTHGNRLATVAKAAERDSRALSSMVDGLLDDVKMALMLPAGSAIEMLPEVVRNASRRLGKEVDFRVDGSEIEIDRRILEDLRNPLVHLVRNSLDHGIEAPDARAAAGKPPRGRVDLRVSQMEGGRVEILVSDDGAGIPFERVRVAARKLGLVHGEGAEADETALLGLIFQSGLSTSPIITDLSGRGLGLAIVREQVERLGGSVSVSSSPGAGTSFRLVLPLTLSTFRGVHVRCGEREFIVPTQHLALVTRVAGKAIGTVENRETITLGGKAIALCRLAQVLGIAGAQAEAESWPAIIAGSGDNRIAFLVDEVLGEQEVLVKSLGRQLRRVRNLFGATVLGSGRVLPILHVPDLLKAARRAAAPERQPIAPAAEGPRSLLVAEDSITARMLLKGILETAGYRVRTAVDGVDAFTQLCTEPFDLLVSDVDMPRMNGFDLTAKVRADKALADLPVVLVTALDSREHKERGAEVGANAYIVKSSFDQSNLLAVIRRLL